MREQLAYCVPLGIPHSTFLGSATPGVWTDDDQDKALVFLRAQSEVCPECGTRDADWIDPTTKRPFYPPLWEPVAIRCYGCAEIARERAQIPEGVNQDGLKIVVQPFDIDRPLPDRPPPRENVPQMPPPPDPSTLPRTP